MTEVMPAARSRPTMRDVAERAGVSLKTVSRVINDEPGVAGRHRGARGRRDRRARLPAQRPRALAAAGRSSSTIGLVIEDVGNPFYSAIAQAVEAAARDRGLMLITASCEEDPERERELVQALLRRRVDALLLVPAAATTRYARASRGENTPVVFLDRPPGGIEADTVLLDNRGGARSAVEHLIAQGHRADRLRRRRRRASTPPTSASPATARRMDGAGVAIDQDLVRLDTHSRRPGRARRARAARAGARPAPHRDLHRQQPPHGRRAARAARPRARGRARGLRRLRARRPAGMPTTVVRHDSQELGRQAAALAFVRLDGATGRPAASWSPPSS